MVSLVTDTAKTKGWHASVDAEDKKNYRYATVSVERTPPGVYQPVTGIFEIICDKKIQVHPTGTSFYKYGLKDLHEAIWNEVWQLPWVQKTDQSKQDGTADVALLERFLRRFHRAARQLKHRYGDRSGIIIDDEYDLQDVVHMVLRGLFDDVRPEEYTPSYAGGSARMDFLLKSEKIVLELKLASSSLRDKQIGEQLLIDIGRYRSHPDCRCLICFVYDPHGHIKNASGLEADLSHTDNELDVKVIVVSV